MGGNLWLSSRDSNRECDASRDEKLWTVTADCMYLASVNLNSITATGTTTKKNWYLRGDGRGRGNNASNKKNVEGGFH